MPVEGTPTAAQLAWAANWRLTAGVVAARTVILVLVGLTPFGAVLLVPLGSVGDAVVVPVTALVVGGLAWLPGRLARPARARIRQALPALQPFRPEGGAAPTGRSRAQRPVLLDHTLPPGQGVERLVAADASLSSGPAVQLLVGRYPGRGVNAWATRVDRAWAVVVAPELLAALDDRELRALLAHERGHLAPAGARCRRLAVLAMLLSVILAGGLLPFLVWAWAVPWLATWPAGAGLVGGTVDPRFGYGAALLTAMQLATGYLTFLVLRPLVLLVFRADEAAADRGMVRMTGDPAGCARFLARQAELFGLPYRWTVPQLLLVATHPAIGDRVDAVSAGAVGGAP